MPRLRSPVRSRSSAPRGGPLGRPLFGDVAEWLGKGLQNPLPGFDSRRRLAVHLRCGRLAQWKSASLTRKRSAVRSRQRPPNEPPRQRGFGQVSDPFRSVVNRSMFRVVTREFPLFRALPRIIRALSAVHGSLRLRRKGGAATVTAVQTSSTSIKQVGRPCCGTSDMRRTRGERAEVPGGSGAG